MTDEEIRALYGMISRIETDIKQTEHYLNAGGNLEQAKHFTADAKYTMQSLRDIINKTKLK